MVGSAQVWDGGVSQAALAVAATLLAASAWLVLPVAVAPIGAVLAVAAVAIAVRQPFLICLAFVALSFFRIHEAYPVLFPLRLPLALAGLTTVALVWHMAAARSIRPFWTIELSAFAAFFGLVTVGVAFAVDRPLAFDYWTGIYVKIGIMTLAVAWLPRDGRDFVTAARVFIVSGVLVGLVAIYNKHMGIGLVELTRVTIGREIGSLLGDPNDLALVLLFPLGFALGFALHRAGRLDRSIGIAALPVILYAIICTQSRGGLLGVLSVLLVFGLDRSRNKLLLVAGLGVAGLAVYRAMGIAGRISGGAAEAGLDASAEGRLDAWIAAVNMALARPLTGVGLNNFAANLYYFTDDFPGRDMAAHSTWFGVLGETGLPGIAAFLAMVGLTARAALRTSARLKQSGPASVRAVAIGTLAALTGFCVAGSFLTQGFTWPLYMLLGLTVALARWADVEATRDDAIPTGLARPAAGGME